MKVAYHLLLLSVQAGFTFVVLLGTYLLLALLDYTGSFPAFFGLLVFQPLMGAFLSLATISVCVLVGLPFRLAAFGSWWRQRPWLALVGAGAGGVLLVLSLFVREASHSFAFTEPWVIALAATGWFLLTFCPLHLFLPDTFLHRLLLNRTRQ